MATLLIVSALESDYVCLRSILAASTWSLHWASTGERALRFAPGNALAVIICERDLPDGDWPDLLEELNQFSSPPLLVVASLHPEHGLWAQGLNLGGYDVLSKQFELKQVLWVLDGARKHCPKR